MKWTFANFAAMALFLGSTSCSILKPPERPAWTTHVLEGGIAENVAGAESPAASHSLRLDAIECSTGYDTPRMAYIQTAGQLEYYARHRWADSPALLLPPILVRALESSGAFAGVLSPTSHARSDFLLETELQTFRHEFEGSSRNFRVELRATFLESMSRRVVGEPKTFTILEPISAESVEAGVAAARHACAKLARELASYCAQTAASGASGTKTTDAPDSAGEMRSSGENGGKKSK